MVFLDAGEALKVPENAAWIVEKATAHITKMNDLLEKARASNEAATIDHEQLFHQLESRFIQLRKEHELACQERDNLRTTLTTVNASQKSAAGTEAATVEENATLQAQLRQRDAKIIILDEDRKSSAERAERQQIRLDKLDNELALQSTQLITNSKQELMLAQQLDEAQRGLVPLKMENARLQTENATHQKQREWAEEQLKEKTDALLALQKKTASSEYELRSENDRLDAERSAMETDLLSERQRTQSLGNKLDSQSVLVSEGVSFASDLLVNVKSDARE
jgi:chromosome segregation ATPase